MSEIGTVKWYDEAKGYGFIMREVARTFSPSRSDHGGGY